METAGLEPKGVNITADDIREGIVGVLSIYMHEPQFQGQTKERLGNPEVQNQVDNAIRAGAGDLPAARTRSAGAAIVERIALAAKAREASRAASQAVSRKTAISPPAEPAGQAGRLLVDRPEQERAVHRRGRLAPVARPSRGASGAPRPSCLCAARC